ncbi:MAG: hypothetical protein RBU37_10765 [Myxococcota bacterium]|jgi:hypothetical protein|nr:hypothetical protein [Myxococcota bacterium]
MKAAFFSVLSLFFLLNPAVAEEANRVFVRYTGEMAKELEAFGMGFEALVLESGRFRLAGTTEMDTVFAECREQMGVSLSEDRECQLKAARRLFVEQVIELSASLTDSGSTRLVLTVWNTDDNTKIFAALADVDDSSQRLLEKGLGDLAHRYLCFSGDERHCSKSDTNAATPAVNNNTQPPMTPTADLPVAPQLPEDSRTIVFNKHPRGEWSLHQRDGTLLCPLPCTHEVPENSGYYLIGLRVDGNEPVELRVPRELGYGDHALSATIDLDDDWQDWEVNALVMLGVGFAVLIPGMVMTAMSFGEEESTGLLTAGIICYAAGGITATIATPIYALYGWWTSPGKDVLQLEPGSQSSAWQFQLSTTF